MSLKRILLAYISATMAAISLAVGVGSIRNDQNSASLDPEHHFQTALASARLQDLTASLAALAVEVEDLRWPSYAARSTLEESRSTPPQQGGIAAFRTRIDRLRELIGLRCKLAKKGGESLRDELFSADHYRGLILDDTLSVRSRAEGFVLLSYLEHAGAYMLGLESRWVRDALVSTDLEVDAAMMMAAWALPRDPMARSVLIDFARFSQSEQARENALIALAEYDGDAEIWKIIDEAARLDVARSVRRTARDLVREAIAEGTTGDQ